VSERFTESAVVVTQVWPSEDEEEVAAIASGLQSLWPTSIRRRVVKVSEQWRFSHRVWRK